MSAVILDMLDLHSRDFAGWSASVELEAARAAVRSGEHLYLCGMTLAVGLHRLAKAGVLNPADVVLYAGATGTVSGARVGRAWVRSGSAWATEDPLTLAHRLELASSASSWAAQAVTAACEEHREPPLLPHRFRPLARRACHVGPMAHVRSYAEHAAYLDLRGAFRAGLEAPAPLARSWVVLGERHRTPDALRRRASDGEFILVTGELDIPPNGLASDYGPHGDVPVWWGVPPLPATAPGEADSYLWGRVCGTWPMDAVVAVEQAMGRDLLVSVAEAASAERGDLGMRGRIAALAAQDKGAAKAVWCRAWGRMICDVQYSRRMNETEWKAVTAEFGGRAPPHRPDWAALVTGRNLARMGAALATMPGWRVCLAHVDSIHVDIADGDAPPPAGWSEDDTANIWAVKGTGEAHYYGPGNYVYSSGASAGARSDAPQAGAAFRQWGFSAQLGGTSIAPMGASPAGARSHMVSPPLDWEGWRTNEQCKADTAIPVVYLETEE